jgi:hypothetical protein
LFLDLPKNNNAKLIYHNKEMFCIQTQHADSLSLKPKSFLYPSKKPPLISDPADLLTEEAVLLCVVWHSQ